jgi:hypothetical protein
MKNFMEGYLKFRKGGNKAMKKTIILALFILPNFLFAINAAADPRMETNKNFCHFILDPQNTDNEVFLADCGSVITTAEKTEQTGTAKIKCEESNRVATGYATVTRLIQQAASPISPGATVTFTSDDSDTPCTMVESNGRAYTSKKWQSTIRAGRASKKGVVTVQYEIFCEEGRE